MPPGGFILTTFLAECSFSSSVSAMAGGGKAF
jgi:hypothetical protein